MFAAPRDLRARKRSESRSTDDHSSTKDVVRKGLPASPAPQRYARELSLSSHSLATTSSQHDDHPSGTSARTQSSHTHSAQTTPITSPSTGYSNLFPGSISSATSASESLPSADAKYSEFGLLNPWSSSTHSPMYGSASSRSSHPASPRSRSTTESDIHSSTPRPLRIHPPTRFSQRPSTAPQPPSVQTTKTGDSPAEHHSRSHFRFTGLKKILSKPGLASPSRFSFQSTGTTPSDSETSTRSHTTKWPITPKKSGPPELDISTPLPSPNRSTHPTDVHRRYVSETTKVYSSRTGTALPTSQESFDTFSPEAPAPSRGRDQKHRNVLRRRPSAAKLQKEGKPERGMSTPSRPEGGADLRLRAKDGSSRSETMPATLTPAGAVVEAYKQQELHREDASSPPNESIDESLAMNPKASMDDGYADDDNSQRSPTPYYTVFGASSERRVPAGGPDDRWSRFEGQMMDNRTWIGTPATSQPETGGRSLTRKVSSRWNKVKGGGVTTELSPSRREVGHLKGRPSFQEVSTRKPNDRDGRAAGRSMDGMPEMRNNAWAGSLAGHARSGSEKEETKEGAEGGGIWKLMKRLSTGGLRDRFNADNVVPPVPALPKELMEKVNQGDRNDHHVDTPLRYPSASHPPPKHRQSSSSHEKDHQSPMPKNILNFATASSSPNSSDVASTQFFQKTHSARSSVSSYGGLAVPPMPEIALDRRIITPLEQLRLGGDHVEADSSMSVPRSPRRSTSIPAALRTADHAISDELPLPSPRRQTCTGDTPMGSPSAPASANSHSSKQQSESYHCNARSFLADGSIALTPPPPRPPRNARRIAGSLGSPAHYSTTKHADSGVADVSQMDRVPSAQSDMTARLDSPSREPARSQLTFRALNAPRPPPLSEREKADIWDDLLARSDEAGGTIHLGAGAGELMSDSMRFSTYSEIS